MARSPQTCSTQRLGLRARSGSFEELANAVSQGNLNTVVDADLAGRLQVDATLGAVGTPAQVRVATAAKLETLDLAQLQFSTAVVPQSFNTATPIANPPQPVI